MDQLENELIEQENNKRDRSEPEEELDHNTSKHPKTNQQYDPLALSSDDSSAAESSESDTEDEIKPKHKKYLNSTPLNNTEQQLEQQKKLVTIPETPANWNTIVEKSKQTIPETPENPRMKSNSNQKGTNNE